MAKPAGRWVPILKVANADASCDFYCGKLGFTKIWVHQFEPNFPKFVSLNRDGLELFLSEHANDGCRAAQIYLYVDDVDDFHRAIAARGVKAEPPRDCEWGTREFDLQDPDGHRFRIGTLRNRTPR